MKQYLVITMTICHFGQSISQEDLYRGIDWTPTYNPIYTYTTKQDNKIQVKRNIGNFIDVEDTALDNSIKKHKISRPKSYKIPENISKTYYKRFENFEPPRPKGPPPNQLKKIKNYQDKSSRVKRALDFDQDKTSRVIKNVGISILAQGLGWLGWVALVTISNENHPFSRSFKNEINFENMKDLEAFQNLIEKKLNKELFKDKSDSVMKDVGIPILAQGLGLLGWTALSTLNNQSNSESRSFENQIDFESMKDLPAFQSLLRQSLQDNFSERQLSPGSSSFVSDAIIFTIVQVVGWSAWAAFATGSNPGTPIPFLG